MLKQGLFKVTFKVKEFLKKDITFIDEMILPYRDEETQHIHVNSTVRKWAETKVKAIFPNYIIDIRKIDMLTEFEEIK